ncbi:MAG: MFS transporter [Chloroflexi bacterium]|nr:MFS transporter [Chloroflexota bacterium]
MDNDLKLRPAFLSSGINFLKRQHHDWKVTVARTSLDKFTYQMIFPYLSIYIVALGASATQLGMVNSVGMIVAGVLGPFIGWLIDRNGPKKIYLAGISLLALAYLTYGLAAFWTVTLVAMMVYWVGHSISTHSCSTVCGNCLANKDRATGMMICETAAAGLLGMAGPMVGAWIVTTSGGVNVDGIRPLFYVAVVSTIGALLIVFTKLSNQKWGAMRKTSANVFRDLYWVMKGGRNLRRWLLVASIGALPLGMVFPFSQVFAHKTQGANEFVLGAMVTGAALTSIAFAIPLGRLADIVGRKKVLFITMPLFWASNLILVWAPSPAFLIFAGVLQGFYYIGSPISMAMERELVPAENMGKWLGITRFVRMLVGACMAFAAGVVWDKVGPQYVFLAFVAIDLLLRLPLLVSMPETLNSRFGKEASEPMA